MRVFVPSRRRERNAITTTAHLAQRYGPAGAVSTGRACNRGKFVHAFSSHPVPLIPLLRVPSQPCTPFLRCFAWRCFGQKKCHVAWQSNNQQIYDGLGAPVTKSVLSGYNLQAPVVVLRPQCLPVRHFPFRSAHGSAVSGIVAVRSNAPRVGPAAAVNTLGVCFRC